MNKSEKKDIKDTTEMEGKVEMTCSYEDPPVGVCGVCGSKKDGSKYRCSACRLPYCSLSCYKSHKAQKEFCETRKRKREEKVEKRAENAKRAKVEAVADSLRRKAPKTKQSSSAAVFEEKERELCRLTEQHYEALTKSDELIGMLKKNSKLREFLKSLDNESDATKRKAKLVCALEETPDFSKFADAALRCMGFLQNDGDGEYFTVKSSLVE